MDLAGQTNRLYDNIMCALNFCLIVTVIFSPTITVA